VPPVPANYQPSSSANNAAPSGNITAPASGNVSAVNTPITFAATFVDTDGNGPRTAAFDFDASNSTAATVNDPARTISLSKSFGTAGVYYVVLVVNDNVGGVTIVNTNGDLDEIIVVYDPNGGFVTGGGWIMSPVNTSLQYMSVGGKANFGFVSKYQKGATIPTGETEFNFKAGNMNFKSSSYEWLVVAGARAQYKGVGTINGTGNYGFLLTAIDSGVNGGGNTDRIRVKIWDKNRADLVVYDNQYGASDDGDAATELGGGSIVIHSK
jgi:hypothetical protein